MPTNLPPTSAIAPTGSPDPLGELITILDLEQLETDLFRAISPQSAWGRVYGGLVLGQAIVAATRTAPGSRVLHSIHGYFLLGGTPVEPIDYQVERLRDGGSFSTRRVTAIQNSKPIFAMIASFQAPEMGLEHQSPMPDVPPPDDVPPLGEVLARPDARVPDTMRAYYARERPFDIRVVDTGRYLGNPSLAPRQHIWMKARRPLPADPVLHHAMLAYASDFALIDTALIAHGKLMFDPGMQLASLDHALWIHRPVRVDDWFLYSLESPAAVGGRGLSRGAFYRQDGVIIATVSQEGLMRPRSTAYVIK